MQRNFDTYLSRFGALTMAALTLVGAGCAGKTQVTTDVPTPSVAVGEPNPSTPPEKPVAAVTVYKDGTYTATGNYVSPGGPEEIKVTITLKADVIVAAEVVPMATNPKSVFMQGQFVSGYKALVVGKKIDEVQLGVVSGSSLTPKGFMEALAEIKVQAKK
jgi:uncharacterized protein with FMN-binding domain